MRNRNEDKQNHNMPLDESMVVHILNTSHLATASQKIHRRTGKDTEQITGRLQAHSLTKERLNRTGLFISGEKR